MTPIDDLELEGGIAIQGVVSVKYEAVPSGLRRVLSTSSGDFESFRICEGGADPAGDWWLDFLRGGQEKLPPKRADLEVVDLFCGSGGLSLGASLASNALGLGFNHAFAADVDRNALGIYRANHKPRFATNESVANLVAYQVTAKNGRASYPHAPRLLDEDLASLAGDVDLLLAGPPCQGHSTVNNKTRFSDPRNLLYQAVPAIAVALGAPAVIIENVPGVTASKEGVVKTAVELLESSGYQVTTKVIRSDAMGWPQTRKRFFLVATKGWSPVDLKDISSALFRDARPISWALQDILAPDEASIMTEAPVMSDENLRRINYLHDNDIYDLPNSERPECHQNGTTYGAVYGRMKWEEPAPTLTTGFMTPGRGRYVHPIKRRTLLPREAARIQGFPDAYRFELPSQLLGRSAIAKGIGDAVPSILGFAAAISALANRPK